MELDSSPGFMQFLLGRENWRAAEGSNTPFCTNMLVDLDSSSLSLICTEDRCEFLRTCRAAVSPA